MIVGIDIGGTFTDLVSCEDGKLTSVKVLSTPHDFSKGFSTALSAVDPDGSRVAQVVHATTVATNALIQRKGARVGLITTEGFRDVLSLRRRDRRLAYGQETAFVPLISRVLRREVRERSTPDETLVVIDVGEIEAAAAALWSSGAEAILIAFIHSVTCPDNELQALEVLNRRWPDKPVFVSHQVTDVREEFARFSTAAASAYVAPLVRHYFCGLRERLPEQDQLSVVTSDGGLANPESATGNPVRTALSGPAAGVCGAQYVGAAAGFDAFVACDMGGTSFDACLLTEGTPALTKDRELDFGIPLAVEMLDIATIGAGGGSIVTISPGGTVDVGPGGTGADPGPACYGKQIHLATVTDADLVLGCIAPSLRLPSGTRELDVAAARKTINERVAQPIGVSIEEAAGLVISTVEEKMADQIRTMGLTRRVDVTDHLLFAYGGAGPLHAAGIAQSLGISTIVVPPVAGLFSAWGGFLTRGRETISSACWFALDDSGEDELGQMMNRHEHLLTASGEGSISHSVEFCSEGHVKSAHVPITPDEPVSNVLDRVKKERLGAGQRFMVSSLTTVCLAPAVRTLKDVLPSLEASESTDSGPREIHFGSDTVVCPVLDRNCLAEGAEGKGPCVIEEAGATTLVPPGHVWHVGRLSLLYVERTSSNRAGSV
jgi:N-methylhydantoinase A